MFRDYRRVKGFEDYIVSNYGEVFSTKRGKCRMLKLASDGSGYLRVDLSQGGIKRTIKVHVLVGNSFVGIRTCGLTFDHIDRNSVNNRADNIRLATKREQNLNRKMKRGKTGEKYIVATTKNKKPYYKFYIKITKNDKSILQKQKYFSFQKYCLDDVVKYRDEYIKNNPQMGLNLL